MAIISPFCVHLLFISNKTETISFKYVQNYKRTLPHKFIQNF
jgi:hypothetical protein